MEMAHGPEFADLCSRSRKEACGAGGGGEEGISFAAPSKRWGGKGLWEEGSRALRQSRGKVGRDGWWGCRGHTLAVWVNASSGRTSPMRAPAPLSPLPSVLSSRCPVGAQCSCRNHLACF